MASDLVEAEEISRAFNSDLGTERGSACAASASSRVGKTPRRDRVDVFRRWALKVFGNDTLSGTVLDVAGGKGDLSWLLANAEESARAVVCDPRPVDHTKLERRASWLYSRLVNEGETLESLTSKYGPQGALSNFPLERLKKPFRQPLHLQVYFDRTLGKALEEAEAWASGGDRASNFGKREQWIQYWKDARAKANAAKVPLHHQPAQLVAERARETGKASASSSLSDDADAALDVLLSAKLLLAFHPDEAVSEVYENRHDTFSVHESISTCISLSLYLTHKHTHLHTRTHTHSTSFCRWSSHVRTSKYRRSQRSILHFIGKLRLLLCLAVFSRHCFLNEVSEMRRMRL